MSKATIEIRLRDYEMQGGMPWYRPNEVISGTITIYPEQNVKCEHLYARLQWRTEGRGTPYKEKVAELDLFQGELQLGFPNEYQFDFRLPDGPWSYEGKYIKTVWEVEVVIDVPWAKDPKESVGFIMEPDRERDAKDWS